MQAFAGEAITVADTAIGFTAATFQPATAPGAASGAFITVETAQIRFRFDGTDPSATVGHIAEIGDVIKLNSAQDCVYFRAIRTGATSAVIHCTYLR